MFLWVQKTLRQPSCRPMFVTLTYSVYMKENRDISIKIRLTEAEKEQLLQRSKEEGKSLSSFIRESALKGRSISKTDVQMIYELRKIGANINQLAKHINTLPSDENILYSLGRINQYLSDVETINRKLL